VTRLQPEGLNYLQSEGLGVLSPGQAKLRLPWAKGSHPFGVKTIEFVSPG